jgi:prolyl 4-hydroxylase
VLIVFPDFFMNMTQLRDKFKFPTAEDLNGAAVALTRLQDTYKLDTKELADGVLLGKKYSRNLTGTALVACYLL